MGAMSGGRVGALAPPLSSDPAAVDSQERATARLPRRPSGSLTLVAGGPRAGASRPSNPLIHESPTRLSYSRDCPPDAMPAPTSTFSVDREPVAHPNLNRTKRIPSRESNHLLSWTPASAFATNRVVAWAGEQALASERYQEHGPARSLRHRHACFQGRNRRCTGSSSVVQTPANADKSTNRRWRDDCGRRAVPIRCTSDAPRNSCVAAKAERRWVRCRCRCPRRPMAVGSTVERPRASRGSGAAPPPSWLRYRGAREPVGRVSAEGDEVGDELGADPIAAGNLGRVDLLKATGALREDEDADLPGGALVDLAVAGEDQAPTAACLLSLPSSQQVVGLELGVVGGAPAEGLEQAPVPARANTPARRARGAAGRGRRGTARCGSGRLRRRSRPPMSPRGPRSAAIRRITLTSRAGR